MKEWQKRVLDEDIALNNRRTKLKRFLIGEDFHRLSDTERDLLVRQYEVMTNYAAILVERIMAFKEE